MVLPLRGGAGTAKGARVMGRCCTLCMGPLATPPGMPCRSVVIEKNVRLLSYLGARARQRACAPRLDDRELAARPAAACDGTHSLNPARWPL